MRRVALPRRTAPSSNPRAAASTTPRHPFPVSQEIDLEESVNCGKVNSKDWRRENCKGFSGTIPPEIGMATKLEAPALDQ